MSRFKTAKERRRRRRIAKKAEKREAKAGIEILSQTTQRVGQVDVTFSVGRIHPIKRDDQ